MEKIRVDMRALKREAEEKGKDIKMHWPVAKKKDYWALVEKASAFRDEFVNTFTAAQGAFLEALGFQRKNLEARGALADIYWAEFLRAEQNGNHIEIVRYEGLVKQYNDGQYDARLKGDGSLSISTRFYPCRCLTEGRLVKPDDLDIMG